MRRKRRITRRDFLKGTAAAAATVTIIPRHALAGPNDKMNVACIGCSGKGGSDSNDISGEYVIAICDADSKRFGGIARKHPGAKRYTDYRKLYDELGDKLDAVTVSTPDHNHFPATMGAIMRGKHAFCQKPLTHNIWEARAITLAARKHKVATQMGIQGHSGEGARLLVEWVRAGAIGKVHEVHYWTNRPIWPQGMGRPSKQDTVPSNLDWDAWLGPAPERPYVGGIYHPFKWRGWWDFGCGALGDIACHSMDAAFWALDLGMPDSITAESSPVNDESAPKWSIVTYQFPARGDMPPVKVIWHDGNKKPSRPKDLESHRKILGGIGGQLIFGDKGTIMANTYCSGPRIIPESKMQAYERPPKTLPRSPGHMRDFVRGCKGGPAPCANFDFAGPLTEMVLLGNLAVRSGKPIEWDGEKMKVTSAPEANKYVMREPRKGWREFYDYGESLISAAKPKPKAEAAPKRSTRPAVDQSAAKAERLYKMGRSAENMRQRSVAKSFYNRIMDQYPNTEAAKKAAARLKTY
jgi:predicted dehydrogenase